MQAWTGAQELEPGGLGHWEGDGGWFSADANNELVLSPVPSLCMALCPLFSSQAFLPLLKKAAQGSPSSALSCSKAAIINMSSSGGSIEEVYLWNYGQAVSYRCSKVLPHCTEHEHRNVPLHVISHAFQSPLSPFTSLHCD